MSVAWQGQSQPSKFYHLFLFTTSYLLLAAMEASGRKMSASWSQNAGGGRVDLKGPQRQQAQGQ